MAGHLRTMQSMELDDEAQLDAAMPIPMADKPRFPYGLRLCLTTDELKKLNIDPESAEVGGMFHGCFMARVTSVGCDSSEHGNGEKRWRIEAQIEDLAIESEDEENEENERNEDKY